MDHSTENVTLAAAFIKDVLDIYKDKPEDHKTLSQMASSVDLSDPMKQVPMKVYNDMCDWIEKSIGQANTKKVGRQIGNTAFLAMQSFKLMPEKPSPFEAMEALKIVAATLIKDPKGRGWEILEKGNKHITMRRTQTFNSTLQLGLLEEITRKTGVFSPKVEYLSKVSDGADFDDYKISWL